MTRFKSVDIKRSLSVSYDNFYSWLKDTYSLKLRESAVAQGYKVYDIHNFNGFSGWNFWRGDILEVQLHLTTLIAGGFVLKTMILENDVENETYYYFNIDGEFVYKSESLDGAPINYMSINMDPLNPFVNHLYNILHTEYNNNFTGFSRTELIASIEKMVRDLHKSHYPLSLASKPIDSSFNNIFNECFRIEKDAILNYHERKSIRTNLFEVLTKVRKTKTRAHSLNFFNYTIPVFTYTIITKIRLFSVNFLSNISWIIHALTIGNCLWFFRTVRNNLGLSIAMALYTPFTFYFITQPINPHAMNVVKEITQMIFRSEDSKKKSSTVIIADSDESEESSSNLKETVSDSWSDRMTSFKDMQMTYEANLEFAPRMGRLEMMEEMLSFPLTAQTAWFTLNSYSAQIKSSLDWNKNLSPNALNHLKKEQQRTLKIKKYIFDKMGQYFKDYPYIIVDLDKEQGEKDFFFKQAFRLYNTMKVELSSDFEIQDGHTLKIVEQIGSDSIQNKKTFVDLFDNLKVNSHTYSYYLNNDIEGLRSELTRQWEMIFLQQNKKQEASSFGLQLYSWSIRNTLWLIQSIYQIKSAELGTLVYKYNLDNEHTDSIMADKVNTDGLTHLFNYLTIEFLTIGHELKALNNDIEYQYRKDIIKIIEKSLKEREKLLNNKLVFADN